MNKKQFLCRYHNLKERVEKKEQLIAEYDRLAGSPPPIVYDRVGSNPNQNTHAYFEKWIYLKIEEEEKLKGLKAELEKVKEETLNAINELENDDYKMLLIYRYMDWLTWEDIQSKMYYSAATIYRWHKEAIGKLKIKNES